MTRSQLGLRGTVILYAGQLLERKGILQYLAAADRACAANADCTLVFVGSGALEPEIRKWADDHPGIPVVSTGFVQPAELPRYFCAADCFVMPTLDDNWSLVSLEALVAGLPQLFSVYNGATAELLRAGETGSSINPYDTNEFARILSDWITRPPGRVPPDRIEEFVKYYSPAAMIERAAGSLSTAVRSSAQAR